MKMKINPCFVFILLAKVKSILFVKNLNVFDMDSGNFYQQFTLTLK